jgi:hypothetical protein
MSYSTQIPSKLVVVVAVVIVVVVVVVYLFGSEHGVTVVSHHWHLVLVAYTGLDWQELC